MQNRFNYIKPNDDFTLHKVGYISFFALLILVLLISGTIQSLVAAAILTCLLVYSLIQVESYVEFFDHEIWFKNSSITKRNILLSWEKIESIQKRFVGLPKSGFITNFYEKSYYELVFILASEKRISVQCNFGDKFEKRIKSEALSRKIQYEEIK